MCRVTAARSMVVAIVVAWVLAASAAAQTPPVHYNHAGILAPGAIGSGRLQQGGPLPGYFQPVEIKAPEGSRVSLAVENRFTPPAPTPLEVGLLIAPVYRLRVTQIPLHLGEEVFPTLEIIDRLYPPPGLARRFPIPVELTQEELDLALSGSFVTRVIYLEEPIGALPIVEDPVHQMYVEAAPGVDPLAMADKMGRAVAILRIGSRMPDDRVGADAKFMYGSPPICFYDRARGNGASPSDALENAAKKVLPKHVIRTSAIKREPLR
jgi:hypothetical protein